ncbi:MAG: porin family protein [Acidiferrobacterales bacterium]
MKIVPTLFAVAIFLTGISGTTLAAEKRVGWYVGAGLGRSDDEVLDDQDVDPKVFGGYQFNRYVALEGAFVGLGRELGPDDLTKEGLAVQVVGTFPIGKRIQVFAKAGSFAWEVNADEVACVDTGSGLLCSVEEVELDDGTDRAYGVGVEYYLGKRWGLRGEWEQFEDVGDSDVDFLSFSVTFHF